MKNNIIFSRREFIKSTGIITVGVGLTGPAALASGSKSVKNKLPRWKGFNLLDSSHPIRQKHEREQLKTISSGWPTGVLILYGFQWLILPI